MNKKHLRKRIAVMVVSVLVLAIYVTLNAVSGFGLDPYTAFSMGVSEQLGISFGLLIILQNIIILIFAWFFGKHLIGIGTLINMSIIGYIVEYLSKFLLYIIPDNIETNIFFRIGILVLGMVIGSLAVSLFFTSNLGVGPYDTIALIITQKTKIHFRWCRITTDSICVIAAFFLGATIGIGTLISAVFLGPLVSFFTQKVAIPLLKEKE